MADYNADKYRNTQPREIRRLVREGSINTPTAGMALGYAQANLVILPGDFAADFERFTAHNPASCPLLEVLPGTPWSKIMAEDGNIVTDVPEYFVYRNGVFKERRHDASPLWRDDYVGFLLGCSFSFEDALAKSGIEMRHIAMGVNVPMYKTDIPTTAAGPFRGPLVCSMRPMTPEQAELAREITAAMPYVHGAPIYMGDPSNLGIANINKPDYGDAVEIYAGEVPVFWPCGVTTQAALAAARPPLVITHSPGHMFITDILNKDLNDFLARLK